MAKKPTTSPTPDMFSPAGTGDAPNHVPPVGGTFALGANPLTGEVLPKLAPTQRDAPADASGSTIKPPAAPAEAAPPPAPEPQTTAEKTAEVLKKPARRKPLLVERISEETVKALAVLDMIEGDGTQPVDQKLIEDMIEGETNLGELLCAYHLKAVEQEAQMAGIDALIDTFTARKAAAKTRAESIKTHIGLIMHRLNLPTINGPQATLSLRLVPPKVEVFDESELPADFFKQPDPVVDKTKLNEAMKARIAAAEAAPPDADGKKPPIELIPGCKLTEAGFALSVRTR